MAEEVQSSEVYVDSPFNAGLQINVGQSGQILNKRTQHLIEQIILLWSIIRTGNTHL